MSCFASAQAAGSQRINWTTNYEEAVNAAKTSSKPLLLFFTGSDWCGWCNKLEEEALASPDFSNSVADKFIFLKLDFPLYSAQDPQLKSRNKQLQQQFGVRSFPTIILFDAQKNQQIATTGYRAGGGKQYADHLMKLVRDYSSYKQKVSMLDQEPLAEKELKQLYEKSKELGLSEESKKILKCGMASDHPLFFAVEQYRLLADEGAIQTVEAAALRERLLAADPDNLHGVHYQIALIDYEGLALKLEKEKSYDTAVEPLLSYIKKFGDSDKENRWRLEMIVSQVYLDCDQMSNALHHAEASYESAPAAARQQIARTIQSIRSQLHSSLSHALTGR
jgi:protein disulfide-isomerase